MSSSAAIETTPTDHDGIAGIVTALQAVWANLMATTPGLPPVTIIIKRDSKAWGHTTIAKTWGAQTREGEGFTLTGERHEIMVSGENLARGPINVLGTLLHEASHALNLANGVRDCDSNGRHNMKFKATAEGTFGLEIRQAGRLGWTDTHVTLDTLERYAAELLIIGTALNMSTVAHTPKVQGLPGFTLPPTGGAAPTPPRKPRNKNNPKAVCACEGSSIRAPLKVIVAGVRCEVCGELFAIV